MSAAVTIPKEVREALRLHTGHRLAFRLRDDGTVSVEAEKISLASLRGAVRPKTRGVTIAVRSEAARKAGSRG